MGKQKRAFFGEKHEGLVFSAWLRILRNEIGLPFFCPTTKKSLLYREKARPILCVPDISVQRSPDVKNKVVS